MFETTQGEKKPYAKPRLMTHGSVEKLTERGHGHEGHEDQGHHGGHEGDDRGGPGSHIWSR